MPTWLVVVLEIVIYLLGFLVGYWTRKKDDRKNALLKGLLLIDKGDPVANGGVYSQFFSDPLSFSDGEVIKLKVSEVNIDLDKNKSQQSQAT